MTRTPVDPGPYLRGFIGEHGIRIPPTYLHRLPADCAIAAAVPAGVRLEMEGTARALEIEFTATDANPLASPTAEDGFSVWTSTGRLGSVPISSIGRVTVPLAAGGRSWVYLPECFIPRVISITPLEGTIEPTALRPRWISHGDSIAQGWSTTDVGAAWTAVTARALDLDVVNLGLAGAARGELPVAEFLASQPADLITLAWGTNCWSMIPMGAALVRELMLDFLAIVRTGHPTTPIVVLSPLVRPDAERTPNLVGASLEEIRSAIEAAVAYRRGAVGDERLHLVGGRDLVPPAELVDGVHPGDAGHARLARAMSRTLGSLLAP